MHSFYRHTYAYAQLFNISEISAFFLPITVNLYSTIVTQSETANVCSLARSSFDRQIGGIRLRKLSMKEITSAIKLAIGCLIIAIKINV